MMLCWWGKKYLPPNKPSLVQEHVKSCKNKAHLKRQQTINPAANVSGASSRVWPGWQRTCQRPTAFEAPAGDQMCYCGAPGVAITKYIWVPLPKALSRPLFFPVDDPLFTGNPLLKVLSLSIDLRGTDTVIAVFYLSPACIAFGNWPDTEQNPGISSFPNDPVSILY